MSKDHLSRTARNRIRYHYRATEQGIARKHGISVAMVREIRANAQPNHPARMAAKVRRLNAIQGIQSRFDDNVKRSIVEAAVVTPPKGQALHVEGGADLPRPLT